MPLFQDLRVSTNATLSKFYNIHFDRFGPLIGRRAIPGRTVPGRRAFSTCDDSIHPRAVAHPWLESFDTRLATDYPTPLRPTFRTRTRFPSRGVPSSSPPRRRPPGIAARIAPSGRETTIAQHRACLLLRRVIHPIGPGTRGCVSPLARGRISSASRRGPRRDVPQARAGHGRNDFAATDAARADGPTRTV